MTAATTAFDVCGPLPQPGVTVLEASAGTGKTFTIAALAARYVAEGRPLGDLLLVTFTRMATGELRERVRDRLVQTEHGLDRALHGDESDDDPIVALLARGPSGDVERRRQQLAKAVADFDAATIVTTHGFCQEVLGGLGIAGDVDTDFAFLEDTRDLVAEVVDDLYVRRFVRAADDDVHIKRAQALEIARLATNNPAAAVVPDPEHATPRAAMRSRFAKAARQEFDRRKRRAALMTYDDLLTTLDETLHGANGDAVSEMLRDRYKIVLVDEFQDTDPVQWSIMRRAFGEGGATLVLIGDPKQAIYAFRGADVYAYLEAAAQTPERPTLRKNFRSDQGLLDAYDALLSGARLGHPDIVYRTVRADHEEQRLRDAPDDSPLRIRVVHRDDPALRTVSNGQYLQVDSAREHVAQDVAADLVELLSRPDATIEGKRVCPGHVAVLVRTNKAAALIRDELEAVGIPAVINGAGSVFGTPQAREWLQLLRAIERPTSTPRARAAALTAFLGWSTSQVAEGTDDEWEQVHQRLHRWARVLRVKGVAALMEEITLTERLPERVLRHAGGERRLTDLRHIGQLLHAAARSEHLGGTALTGWLRRRIAEAEQDTADEERSRRLESDAEAVQVLTIHRSKGLEFPIVYLPYLWDPTHVPRTPVPVTFHDPDNGDRRTIDVGLEGRTYNDHRRRHIDEERGEDLRLAYVALTRAKHQAVVWWAASKGSRDSALSRLMFDRDEEGNVAPSGTSVPGDADATAAFEELAASAPGRISVERSTLPPPRRWEPPRTLGADLTAADFVRELDWRWRRTSFSDITAGTHDDVRVTSEPEEPLVVDELEVEPVMPGSAGGEEVPLAVMPAGVQIGTFVHEVFEVTDFAAPDLEAELAEHVAAARRRRGVDIGDPDAVVAGLSAAIRTPLAHGGIALSDVERKDRLDELQFELPLVGGDTPTGAKLTMEALASTLRDHLEPDDPLVGYPALLRDPALRHSVRGFLTGSIDLVLRAGEQFAVVDYKTNWLGDTALTAWHHRPEALAETMQRSHYALQALLYSVALHRYLRWRLPAYDPARNLGGIFYLFVRGMVGEPGGGVFAWRPPAPLVVALSDLFGAGTA
ncbi:MAG TPA: UvrD-helicase domain-containing protein [Solirubrobacteraceae bacterium]